MKNAFTLLLFILSINLSAQEELSYSYRNEMYSKSLYELKLLRNEFFARQGYAFKSEKLTQHFNQFDWYKGTKSIDEIVLSTTDKQKVDFIKKVETRKALNKSRIETLHLLSRLPGKSMGSWDWPIEDRKRYAKDCEEVGYLINNNSGMMQKSFIEDKHLFVQVVDGTWEFVVIPIAPNKFFILTNDIVGGGNSLEAYLSNDTAITRLDTKILPDNWEQNFQPSNKDCELPCSPFMFDFTINKDTISVKSWKDDCLLEKELTFRLNKEKMTYELITP